MLKYTFLILFHTFIITTSDPGKKIHNSYAHLPPLFDFDNYDQCMLLEEKALYCTFTFTLEPLHAERDNFIWNIIKNVSADPRNYRHDRLRHGICVPTKCTTVANINANITSQEMPIRKKVETCYNEKFKSLELKGKVSDVVCNTIESKYIVDKYDIIIGVLLVIYIVFVITASIHEGLIGNKNNDVYYRSNSMSRARRVIMAFSLYKNWLRLTAVSHNKETAKLRSIQGMRFFNMICVILCHTIMASFAGPVANPKYIENVTNNALNMFIANGQYAVQTFFVISSWLLSFHFFCILEQRKNISIKYMALAFVNRYIRLTPALAVMLAIESTWIVHMGKGPQWDALVAEEYRNCKENWWTNILYINNYVGKKTMCLHQTWYIAADTQLFIFGMILLMIMSRFHHGKIKTVFAITVILGILIQGSIAFVENYDIVVRQYPEALYNMNVLKSDIWHDLYSSGHSNITGYMIGLWAGYLFYKYKDTQLCINKVYVTLWWILTFGLCIFVVLIAGIMYKPNYKYTRMESALYWALGKNLFALGIAIGIFGFTQRVGWFARRICEWKAVQVLGRLTYSTYIIHVTLIRIRAGLTRYPLFINDYLMASTALGDILLSYLGGTILCLMVEMPVSALQKMMLPPQSTTNKTDVPSEKPLKNRKEYGSENVTCTKV